MYTLNEPPPLHTYQWYQLADRNELHYGERVWLNYRTRAWQSAFIREGDEWQKKDFLNNDNGN